MKKSVLVLIVVLWFYNPVSLGAIGDQWDARTDFSCASNPNGPWMYMAWPGLTPMVADSGSHGYGCGWKNPDAAYQTIARDTVDTNCVGGHGHAGLRWTSPVNGWIQLSGYLFMRQDDDPTRVHWFILKQNGVEFSRASVKLNPDQTAIVGAAGKVTLQEGSGGPNVLLRSVSVGDIIDMGIENIGGPGHFYSAMFHILQVEAPPSPNSWDAGLDFSTASNPNGQWSYLTQPGRVLMSYTSNLHGFPGWYDSSNGTFSIQKPSWAGPNEVGGHSNVCLRWTSPVDDRIQVSGHLWMAEISDPGRVQWYHLEHNGVPFSAGVVKQDPNLIYTGYGSTYYGGVLGRAGTVDFTQGDTGPDALIREVKVGDTIDLVIKENHYYGAAFSIERLGPACGDSAHPYSAGDLDGDCKVGMLDFNKLAADYLTDVTPSAAVSGNVLDAPVTAPDGSITFTMSDNAALLPDVPYSVVFFEDDFTAGRKPQWLDLIGEWGPNWDETYAQSGKLIGDAGENTVVVAGDENKKWTDQVVSVEGTFSPEGIFIGIMLRHNGGHDFILAFYNSDSQRLAIHDVKGRGNWGDLLGLISPCPLDDSRTVTLVATAIGNQVTAAITDGLPGHTYTTQATITRNLGPGYVGLFNVKENVWCDVAYDNFVAKSPVLSAGPVQVIIPAGVTGIPALQADNSVTATGVSGMQNNLRTVTIRTGGDLVKH